MAYNPAQQRISGRFSGPGIKTQPTAPAGITPAVLAQAKAQLAASNKAAVTRAAVRTHQTPAQRALARDYARAQVIIAANKRAARAKVKAAERRVKAAQVAQQRIATGHTRALSLGAAAGQRAPEGRPATSLGSGRSGPAPGAKAVQARLRLYQQGRI